MIPNESIVYYVEPFQSFLAPIAMKRNNVEPLPIEVLVTRYRRNNRLDNTGSVIPATRIVHADTDMWWVDNSGDYFQGAQVLDRPVRYLAGPIMALLDDGGFAVGRSAGEHHTTGEAVLSNVRRSDGRRIPGSVASSFVSNRIVKAAPWAHELMPEAGDTQAVVDQKALIAKLKYEQRVKKGEIYKEGMRRDWLDQLDTLRPAHDMPVPHFRIGVSGTYVRQLSARIDQDTLAAPDRTALGAIAERLVRPEESAILSGGMRQFAGVPFTTITSLTASTYGAMMNLTRNDLDYAVATSLNQSGGLVIETNRFPILSTF